MLSFLAHDNFDTPVKGIQTLVPEYEAKYGTNLPNNRSTVSAQARRLTTALPRGLLLGLPRHDGPRRNRSALLPLRTVGNL